jgi:hypothetical protein
VGTVDNRRRLAAPRWPNWRPSVDTWAPGRRDGPTGAEAIVESAPWGRIVLVDAGGVEFATWTIEGCGRPDLATVDAVARWLLFARQFGFSLVARDMDPDLAHLLDLAGLLREVTREAEAREQQLGVQEGVEPGDAAT